MRLTEVVAKAASPLVPRLYFFVTKTSFKEFSRCVELFSWAMLCCGAKLGGGESCADKTFLTQEVSDIGISFCSLFCFPQKVSILCGMEPLFISQIQA